MIVGAQKAGTTALKNYLNEHPEVLGHPQVEFSFFQDEQVFSKGEEAIFRSQFTEGDKAKAKAVIAKHALAYISERVISRLHEHNPNCKLVFVVREPASRAYSAFQMEVARGWVDQQFDHLQHVIQNKQEQDLMYRTFIHLGMYAQSLKMILRYFPSEQVKMVPFEVFKSNPTNLCQELFAWLEIDPTFSPNTAVRHNEGNLPKSKRISKLLNQAKREGNPIKKLAKAVIPYHYFIKISGALLSANASDKKAAPIPPEMKQFLQEFYVDEMRELEDMTGLDLNAWRPRKDASNA